MMQIYSKTGEEITALTFRSGDMHNMLRRLSGVFAKETQSQKDKHADLITDLDKLLAEIGDNKV